MKKLLGPILMAAALGGCAGTPSPAPGTQMLVHLAQIEVYPQYLEEYLTYVRENGAASMTNEAGVIALYPVYEANKRDLVMVLEIYADEEAYQAHLNSAHFLKYKQGTLKMVKSLNIVDLGQISPELLPVTFKKAAP